MNRYVSSLMTSALALLFGCTPADRSALQVNGGSSESGGATAAGGQSGSNDSGGSSGSGGVPNSGGASGSGGETSAGGNQGSGGSNDSGGSQGSGGSDGGSSGSSGSSGGSSGSGGTSSTGTNTCGTTTSGTTVGFCNGLASGAMAGYGWVALGSADTITDPTCDTGKVAITQAAPCLTNTNWNQANALCMSGKVPALPATPVAADYSSNWGVQLGVNAKDPNGGMGGSAWKSITYSMTGSPSSGLRAVLHKNGDPDATSYCASMTLGTAMPITTFNSKCWDGTGDFLTESDGPTIDKVGVQVSSTATEITVSSLCLTKVEFGN